MAGIILNFVKDMKQTRPKECKGLFSPTYELRRKAATLDSVQRQRIGAQLRAGVDRRTELKLKKGYTKRKAERKAVLLSIVRTIVFSPPPKLVLVSNLYLYFNGERNKSFWKFVFNG